MDRIIVLPVEDGYWMVHLESKTSGLKFPTLDEALDSAMATVSFTTEGQITEIIVQDFNGNWQPYWSNFPSQKDIKTICKRLDLITTFIELNAINSIKVLIDDFKEKSSFNELNHILSLLERTDYQEAKNKIIAFRNKYEPMTLSEGIPEITDQEAARIAKKLGDEKVKEGKLDEALQNFSIAIDDDPAYVEAYTARSFVYFRLNKHKEAIEDISKALKIDPQNIIAYNTRAGIKESLGMHEESISDLDKVVELNPNYYIWYKNRGIVKMSLDRYSEAIDDFTKAAELKEDDYDIYLQRGTSYLNNSLFENALLDLTKSISLNPKSDTAFYNRGNTYLKLKKYKEAVSDYDKAIQLNHQDDYSYNNRAIVKYKLGEYDEAIKDFEQAIKINPTKTSSIEGLREARKKLEESRKNQ